MYMALKTPINAEIGGLSFVGSRGTSLKLKVGIDLPKSDKGARPLAMPCCSMQQAPPPAWPGRAVPEPGRKVWDSPKPISVLGSTGSIGTQTLGLIADYPDKFMVVALAAGSNVTLLAEQVKTFKPQVVALRNESLIADLKEAIADADYKPEIIAGEQGVIVAARHPDAATVVTGIVGCAGLKPTVAAIESGKDIAMANKETLIAGGPFVLPLAHKHNVKILPSDSEHSAVFQGLEVIEGHYLFGTDYDHIDIVIHEQSIIHSMVETQDSSVLAQLGWPDMRIPLLYTMSWPERVYCPESYLHVLDLAKAPDKVKFPSINLAYAAGRAGGTMTGVLSAANEKAVELFINEKISYLDIFKVVEETCDAHRSELVANPSLEEIIHYDLWARDFAEKLQKTSDLSPVAV